MLEKVKWISYIAGGCILTTLSVLWFLPNDNTEELQFSHWSQEEDIYSDEEVNKEEHIQADPLWIKIDIKGEVKASGVYEMEEGKRVIDAIEKAGGLTDEADERHVNLAETLRDEMVIYVPREGEHGEGEYHFGTDNSGPTKIRVNYADAMELEAIPGIGPAKAQAIITYREDHGRFSEINDLEKVGGIGPKSIEQMKEYISVD
ncbi:helix-hairpin-helix domain-containing protein [Thalassorhabdus alkalitolerans]|uniref:Helix-hairpin-helix domain-containing protein n=1 Tax=Thalassorhabdus alkalitolerans TaxID=2282697 RepID=A0ABW0YQ22_9BACI